MNAPSKLLPLALFAIAATSLFSVQPAQAYTVTLEQVGADVVATGGGAFNLTGLTFQGQFNTAFAPGIAAVSGLIQTGPIVGSVGLNAYTGLTGPSNFGSASFFQANTGSGDVVSIFLGAYLYVPQGYISGAPLSSSATWNSATFTSLGPTPGTYEWTWGDGANQQFILEIGESVPDGGSTVWLLGCALLGLVVLRRKLSC